jgi:hypothetical protein
MATETTIPEEIKQKATEYNNQYSSVRSLYAAVLYGYSLSQSQPVSSSVEERGIKLVRGLIKKTELKIAANKYAERCCNGQFPIEYTREQVIKHTANDFEEGAMWQASQPVSTKKKVLKAEAMPEFDEAIENMSQESKDRVDKTLEAATLDEQNEKFELIKGCADRLKELIPYHVKPYNLGDSGEVLNLIETIIKITNNKGSKA